MAKAMIYHGSNKKILTPKIIQGRNTKDFGTAFYCTTIKEQAQRWAKRFSTPVVNAYSFLPNEGLNIIEFPSMSEEWLDFIVSCRFGNSHNYDIVIGPMADDQIYNYVSDFVDGEITREQFWVMTKFKYPTQQIAFCSEKSLDCISFQYYEE